MEIYILRHAQSNPTKSLHSSEWPLSERGIEQANRLIPILKNLNPDSIYSSPYRRCIDTIEPYLSTVERNVLIVEELRECHVTHQFLDTKEDFEEVFRKSWLDFDFCLSDGESCRAAQQRILTFIESLYSQPYNKILISTHGNLASLLINSVDSFFCYEQSRSLTNPDLLRFEFCNRLIWDRYYNSREVLGSLSTAQIETPLSLD